MARLIRPAELDCLIKYVKKTVLGVVEIGTLDGETACCLAQNTNAHCYSIDPLIPDSMNPEVIGSESNILKNTEDLTNFTFIKDYSFNVATRWDKEVDLIFLDGDHNYEAVKKDFEDWFPFLSLEGHLVFHDSGANRGGPERWPGPSKLTDELIKYCKNLTYIETVESLTVFKKKI